MTNAPGNIAFWPSRSLRTADLTPTLAAIRQVIIDPRANTRLSLIVLLGVVIIALLVVLVVIVLTTPTRKKVVKIRSYVGTAPTVAPGHGPATAEAGSEAGSPGSSERRKAPNSLFLALTGPVAVGVLVVAAFLGVYVATSTDVYCAKTCHGSSEGVLQASQLRHAPCVACHEAGYVAIFSNASSRLRMVTAYALGHSPADASVVVDSRQCLGCHARVAGKTTVSTEGLRMSHKEVVSAGQPCRECHAQSGHVNDVYTSTMSACLPCHDTRVASADCITCHTQDPSAASLASGQAGERLGTGSFVYPAVRAANRQCGGCHDQEKKCDSCHGLRMPHSEAFKKAAHARSAAFDKKAACWKCHDPQWCSNGNCHYGSFKAHAGDWESEHKRSAWDAGCVCHQDRGTARTGPMCALCHAPDHSLLPPVH
jgi:hypothetical protein